MGLRFYRWIVRLHPAVFRERFGGEMLCVYDEAAGGERPRLVADGVVSLARQWVARSGYWIVGGAVVGAGLQMAVAGTAWLEAARRALTQWIPDPSVRNDPSAQTAVYLLGAGLVCAVLLLMTAVASLVGGAARRKS